MIHLLDRWNARKVLGKFWRAHQSCGIAVNIPTLRQPVKPRANGSQRPSHGSLHQPPIVQLSQVATNLQMIHTLHFYSLLGKVSSEAKNLAAVGAQGVR